MKMVNSGQGSEKMPRIIIGGKIFAFTSVADNLRKIHNNLNYNLKMD